MFGRHQTRMPTAEDALPGARSRCPSPMPTWCWARR